MLYEGDLSDEITDLFLNKSAFLAIDTETTGLDPIHNRLCLVQIENECSTYAAVRVPRATYAGQYGAPNLVKVLKSQVPKIFHFARFDLGFLAKKYDLINPFTLKLEIPNVFCTKVASKLVRTYTNQHGLATLEKELLSIERDKSQGTTNWAAPTLSDNQLTYARNDVKNLEALKSALLLMAQQEGRENLIWGAMEVIPHLVVQDLLGFKGAGVYEH